MWIFLLNSYQSNSCLHLKTNSFGDLFNTHTHTRLLKIKFIFRLGILTLEANTKKTEFKNLKEFVILKKRLTFYVMAYENTILET